MQWPFDTWTTIQVLVRQTWVTLAHTQIQKLHRHLVSEVLKQFKVLQIKLLPDGVVVADFPESGINQGMGDLGFGALSFFARHTSHATRHASRITRHKSHVAFHTSHVACHTSRIATRHTGIMAFNTHLWVDGVPPTSPLDPSHTSRTCSFTEALLSVLLMICGGGLLRISDTERYAHPASLINLLIFARTLQMRGHWSSTQHRDQR